MQYPVYVFDAYGTLFDVHSAVGRLRARIGPQADRLSDLWRNKQLEYSWVRSLMGAYRNFEDITADALDFAASRCGGISPDLRADLLDAYRVLDAYADVRPALEALRRKGAKTAVLSNGTPAMLADAVKAAGLADCLDAILSVDALRTYKTAPAVYQMACDHFGVGAQAISFQSSNNWDIAGAKRFGFRPVWINRTGQPAEYVDCAPAAVLKSLDGIATVVD